MNCCSYGSLSWRCRPERYASSTRAILILPEEQCDANLLGVSYVTAQTLHRVGNIERKEAALKRPLSLGEYSFQFWN